MADCLRMRLETDSDGTAELFVEVAHAAYAGFGSAWFSLQEIAEFGLLLQDSYPIPQGTTLDLVGGYWSATQPASLEQRHVAISVYAIGSTGTVGVHVELQTPLQREERPQSQCCVRVELKTYYEPLRTFGASLISLAKGEIPVAELACHAA